MNNHHVRTSLLALLLAAGAIFTPVAKAATTCSATTTSLNFGTVSLTGTTDVSATFQVTCSTFGLSLLANAKVRMCLNINDGTSGGGNFNPRRMLSGANPLQFQLYTDAARSQIWGSRGNPTVPNPLLVDFDYSVPVLGGSQVKTITIYGRIPSTQTFVAGSYINEFSGAHTSIDYRYDETLLGDSTTPDACVSGGDGGASVSSAFPFTATANVGPQCLAYTTTDLDFGSVTGNIAANLDQTSTIGLTCIVGTAWKLGLDNGLNASGITRRMRLGATSNYVSYELYRDTGRSQRWGGTLGIDTVQGTGTGSAQTVTVFGRVPAPQTPAAGSYSDTITVTITY